MDGQQPPSDAAPTSRLKPRKTWIAFLLSMFWPGLGQLYAGAPIRAVSALGVFVCLFASFVPFSRILMVLSLAWFLVGCGLTVVALYLLVPLDAAWTAKRRRLNPLGPWNRVSIYVGYGVFVSIGLALTVPAVENLFPIRAFRVPAGTMMDTLLAGDVVLVDMRRSRLHKLERGDIVVFDMPLEPQTLYVKRLIGLPGETIEIRRGTVYVNGAPLEEPYINRNYLRGVSDCGPFEVGTGRYFMLGDHRNASYDSREWGSVPEALLRGKARRVYYSVSRDPESVIGTVRWERIGMSLAGAGLAP